MLPTRCYCLLLLLLLYYPFSARSQGSVLAQGDWYKIGVTSSGVYRLDAAFLKQLGIPTGSINPANLQLYGNGGAMLPQANNAPRLPDLTQNAIRVVGEADGRFDNGDYILFYGQSPHIIAYDTTTGYLGHQTNIYSDTTFYFLTVGQSPGLRVQDQPGINSGNLLNSYDDYAFHELDQKNILQSGRAWFGESFSFTNQYSFNFPGPAPVPGSPVRVISSVLGIALGSTQFQVQLNGQTLGNQPIRGISGGRYDYQGYTRTDTFTTTAPAGPFNLSILFNNQGVSGAQGYLNYLGIQSLRTLALSGNETTFRSVALRTLPDATLNIQGFGPGYQLWDITDPLQPSNLLYTLNGNTATCGIRGGAVRTWIAFTGNGYHTPVSGRKIANQNLRGMAVPELLIVAPPAFMTPARQLAAFRQSHDGLSAAVVSTEQVFNEFSSGSLDVSAVRDLARYFYNQQPGTLRYLLLFGDATFDYKNRLFNQPSFVPVYESRESLHPIFSYSSDDYFGFMQPGEGDWPETPAGDYTSDIGVGRLPVKTVQEAQEMVDKLINYATNPATLGKWRNRVTFVADDGDNNIHQLDADRLAEGVEAAYPLYNVNKIYLDAYPQVTTPAGQQAPVVEAAINQAVDEGSLIVNYTGHGGESGWAEEQILKLSDILSWKNANNLPLFVTATCEFGRYDNPSLTSGAELILMDKRNGGIGLLTTTRPVFSNTNFLLNKAFYNAVFAQNSGVFPRLGDVIQQTKNNSLSGSVNRNFSLLGDPSMRLVYPQYAVALTRLNGKSVDEPLDTLKALSYVTLEGEVRQPGTGGLAADFNGVLTTTVYDKQSLITTLGTINDGSPSPKMTFSQLQDLLFQGKATIRNGQFSLSFTVPRDIRYTFGNGKISFYAQNNAATADAAGAFTQAVVGGTAPNPPVDTQPPVIRLFLNDTTFVPGGTVSGTPVLLARLSDNTGINISDEGIGHSITLTLNDSTGSLVLNEYFCADIDKPNQGSLAYPLPNLPKGKNILTLKAWDVYNNSAEASLEFIVADNAQLALQYVMGYPNPFAIHTSTWATFGFEHNRVGEDLEVSVDIFDLAGQRIKTFSVQIDEADAYVEPIQWNGGSDAGTPVAPGMYLFNVSVRSLQDGSQAHKAGKIVVLH